MNYKIVRCKSCAGFMKPLLNEYYCPFCEKDENKDKTKTFGFSLLNKEWIDDQKEKIIPKGSGIYLFKTEEDINDAYKLSILADIVPVVINLTYEYDINWSFILSPRMHVTTKDLIFEIL